MSTFTDDQVREALIESLRERGEEYSDLNALDGVCMYSTPEGEPSCIVGMVIARLDPEAFTQIAATENAERREGAGSCDVYGHEADTVVPLAMNVSAEALGLLLEAQKAQDTGASYGYVAEECGLDAF